MLKISKENLNVSTNWIVEKRQGATYTGGPIHIFTNGLVAACLCSDRVALLNLETGLVEKFLPSDNKIASTEPITYFILTPNGQRLITFSRNLLVRVYDTSFLQTTVTAYIHQQQQQQQRQSSSPSLSFSNVSVPCIRNWKGHRLPVLTADVDPSSTLIASGSNDRSIIVWDIEKGYSTHNLRGHESIITCIRFQPDTTMVQRLVSASEDGNVRVWDLVTSSLIISINEHYSAVTSIIFSSDASGYYMITGGRDKVLNIWDTRDFQGDGDKSTLINTALKATVPTNESIEGMVMFPDDTTNSGTNTNTMTTTMGRVDTGKEITFATAGNRGLLRIWKLVVQGSNRTNRTYGCGCIGVRTGKDIRQSLINHNDTMNNFTHKDTINQIVTQATTGDDTTVPLSSQFEHLLLRYRPITTAASKTPQKTSKFSSASSSLSDFTTQNYSFDLFTATRDQLLSIIRINTLKSVKNIAGFHDQFTDVKYIPRSLPSSSSSSSSSSAAPSPVPQRLLAIATNSEQLRIVNADTFSTTLCEGHTDIVLSVAPSPDGTLVASSSKDHTIRIWDVATGICLGVCTGHTEAVGTLSFPMKPSNFIRAVSSTNTKDTYHGTNGWLVSGSKDRTLKLWQLSTLLAKLPSPRPDEWNPYTDIFGSNDPKSKAFSALPYQARTSAAVVAHDKDINAVAVAPNDKIIASASQDKTIKLWSVPDLGLIATLRGHKRGVWSIAFSPSDQILASASGDNTIRLWAVSPSAGYNCIRTFEGHDSSVLSVRFIRQGAQLLSVGADGLLKLWNTNDTTECINTFDAHSDKIWALAVRPNDMNTIEDAVNDTTGNDTSEMKKVIPNYEVQIVTAGADSILNIWRDVTSATATGEIEAAEEALMKQQNLFNAMAMRDYTKAITLTLELDQPGRCGDILQELLEIGPTPPAHAPNKDERFRQLMLKEVRTMQSVDAITIKNGTEIATVMDDTDGTRFERSMLSGLHEEGMKMLLNILENLTATQMMTLLNYIREWNTQSRHGSLAQNILYLILKYLPRGHLLAILTEIKNEEHRRSFSGTGTGGTTGDGEDEEDTDTNARNMVTKVLPGVGTIKVPTAPTALSRENKLTPVANTINKEEENDLAGLLNLSSSTANNTNNENSTGPKPSTLAAAELRGLIATLLPYTQRHLDRLDRLQISTYLVDTTVYAMRGLLPNDKETIKEQEDARQRLLGEGVHKKVVPTILPSTKRAYENEDSGSSEDDEDDEDYRMSGKGWLGTVVVPRSSTSTATAGVEGKQRNTETLISATKNGSIVQNGKSSTGSTVAPATKETKTMPKKRAKITSTGTNSKEELDEEPPVEEVTKPSVASTVRQSSRLRSTAAKK